MTKCAILDDYQNVALTMADWSSLKSNMSITSYNNHFKTEDELVHAMSDYDVIVAMRERTPFSDTVFKSLPKLKLLVTSGMRNSSIDLDSATKHGVLVSGTASYSEPPVELTWGLIIALARNIVSESQAVKDGRWQSTIGIDLKGKQLGILGLGKTGAPVARVGKSFGMNVTAWSQNLTKEMAAAEGVQLASSKSELIESSDFITVHLVLGPRTQNLVTSEDFNRMRKGCFFINTSRAGIVDQKALINAVMNRQIAGAASDVFETEPLPANHQLRNLPNFIATPHLGYVTERNYQSYFGEAVENIQAFLNGSSIRQLNPMTEVNKAFSHKA